MLEVGDGEFVQWGVVLRQVVQEQVMQEVVFRSHLPLIFICDSCPTW